MIEFDDNALLFCWFWKEESNRSRPLNKRTIIYQLLRHCLNIFERIEVNHFINRIWRINYTYRFKIEVIRVKICKHLLQFRNRISKFPLFVGVNRFFGSSSYCVMMGSNRDSLRQLHHPLLILRPRLHSTIILIKLLISNQLIGDDSHIANSYVLAPRQNR